MPDCHQAVSELNWVVAECYREMGKPGVTQQFSKDLREVILKIELSIELLQSAEHDGKSHRCR